MFNGNSFKELLKFNAEKLGNKVAISLEEKELTFEELDKQSSKFAGGLIKLGLKKNERVALMLPRILEFPISFFAANKAGLVSVLLHVAYKEDELLPILKETEVKVLITVPTVVELIKKMKNELNSLKSVIVCSDEKLKDTMVFNEVLESGSESFEGEKMKEDEFSVLIYPHGTASRKKGIMLTEKSLLFAAKGMAKALQLTKDDSIVDILPLNFVYSIVDILPLNFVYGLSGVLLTGLVSSSRIYLVRKFVAQKVLELIEREKTTTFMGVPLAYILLCMGTESDRYILPASAKYFICGGAPLPYEVTRRFREIYNRDIIESYGLTECSGGTHINPVNANKIGSVGRPLDGVEVKLFDENGNDVTGKGIGEIAIKSGGNMIGYYKQKEETERVLKDGFVLTGDVGKIDDDGYLYVVDRKKDVIVTSDYKIYPREIENVICSHPKVCECKVIGVKDVFMGEVAKAFVVLKKGEQIEREELIEWCKSKIAPFEIPKYVTFIDSIPKNKDGSVNSDELKKIATGL